MDFFALRSEAIEWAEEVDVSHPAKSTHVRIQSAALESSTDKLLDLMYKQQKQLDNLTKLVQDKFTNLSKPHTVTSRRQLNTTCTFCNKTGHTTDTCYQRQIKEANNTIEELRKQAKIRSNQEN